MIDVIIIGAGPAGLTLGAELAARGISCRIYEKRIKRSISSRAIGLLPYTLELLDTRNLAVTMIEQGVIIDKIPLGNERFLQLNKINQDTKFPFMLSLPQNHIEIILESWALAAGAEIVKGTSFIELKENSDHVIISIADKDGKIWQDSAKFLIGCDGANSTVRNLLNLSYNEVDYKKTLMHGDVRLRNPPENAVYANATRQGMMAVFPLPDGYYRLLILDHAKMNEEVSKEVSIDDFAASALKLSKIDFGIYDPLWISRFNAKQKHVFKYREKQIFLLGDAAHTHMPAGGQGLQSAIEDAFNFGWKLYEVLKNKISESLLSSYELERRQIAEKAMRKSQLLFKYEISNSLLASILRSLINKVIKLPILQQYILRSLSGLQNNYKNISPSKNKYIGKSVLNYRICDDNGKLHEIRMLLRNRKAIFLTKAEGYIQDAINGMYKHIDTVMLKGWLYEDISIEAMIVRPDGIVAWAIFKKNKSL